MLFHVLCVANKPVIEINLTENDVKEIINGLKSKDEIVLNGYFINKNNIKRLKIIESEFDYNTLWKMEFNDSQAIGALNMPNETLVFDSDNVHDVTRKFIGG